MEFKRMSDVVDSFVDAKLAIDFYEGTDEQFEELGGILEDMTEARPFDGKTYYAYMILYRSDYPLLTCEDNSVSSYIRSSQDCRKHILTIEQVLEIARNEHATYSEEDFNEVF